ncbi:MAG: CDGSH iron-sulfur domain-containing protein [Candidatus Thermoplasmatota archaeon]|jgi:CDGSH-type Zn-finger protein|nr:CDGSH iron-sulfur domain-containing protein [Cuniculiplasma sp.]MCL4320712.1 CDGSH iron-sulfur domain-containing protein [Candidatus Thermoplasmatota archaeon]MCL5787941.1 CDGSH iron-sulfur domain-containing protein [Candidatus Thermoplasmatota archaeon]MCL6014035.1 CDGSH iron-sulfur domain-containing protein [Candidatus Thermoplasmatota archaeon]
MSRIVLHEKDRPYVIKAGDQELHICACGLSGNKPYCDGSHKKTLDEKEGVFMYDHEGNRTKVESFYPKQ